MSEDMEFNLGWLVQAEAVAKGSGLWTVFVARCGCGKSVSWSFCMARYDVARREKPWEAAPWRFRSVSSSGSK